jgi:SAM-dependent methyltransferase
MNNKEWYQTWFGNDYLTVYAHRGDHEARKVINLILNYVCLEPQNRILDLCCGQGRHALYLADLGYQVFGVDLSRTLLEIAKFRQTKNQPAYFIQADMRYLPIRNRFDLLLNLFTSFGYFETDRENEEVFNQFYQALKPGGNFVFDYLNKSYVISHLVPYHKEQIEDVQVKQERFIEGSRVKKIITLNKAGKRSIFHESVKMYGPEELLLMFKKANLKVLQIFGDYNGEALDETSQRFIAIGQRQ